MRYRVDTVQRGDLREAITANGELQALRRVNVGVQVTAAIAEVHVKEGQVVKAGDLLVTLDQEALRQALTQAELGEAMARKDLEGARAVFVQKQGTYLRQEALMKEDLISREDHAQARLGLATAEVALERARLAARQSEAQVAIAREALRKTEIRASMAGVVTGLKAEKGETAIAGQTSIAGAVLMVISDTSELLAEVKVGELEVVKLKAGQPAELQVDAVPGTVFSGRVLDVATSLDKSAQALGESSDPQSYRVRVLIQGSARELERLYPGMTARVAVMSSEVKGVLMVPLQAIQEREVVRGGLGLMTGTHLVAWVVKDGRVEERPLKAGVVTRQAMEVVEGLAEGEQVVTGPARAMAALAPGASVRLHAEPAAGQGPGR